MLDYKTNFILMDYLSHLLCKSIVVLSDTKLDPDTGQGFSSMVLLELRGGPQWCQSIVINGFYFHSAEYFKIAMNIFFQH